MSSKQVARKLNSSPDDLPSPIPQTCTKHGEYTDVCPECFRKSLQRTSDKLFRVQEYLTIQEYKVQFANRTFNAKCCISYLANKAWKQAEHDKPITDIYQRSNSLKDALHIVFDARDAIRTQLRSL